MNIKRKYRRLTVVNLNKEENKTYGKYHCPGMPNYARRPKNSVYYNAGSTTIHELYKATAALMLQKWGDVKFNDATKKGLLELSRSIDLSFKEFPKQKKNFLTEVVPNAERTIDNKERRVDLVRLEDDYRFEFENNKNIKKDLGREKTVTIQI
jgi:hypothetical protein